MTLTAIKSKPMTLRELRAQGPVRVYRNLHRKCWSVQGKDGLVKRHVQAFKLKDVKLVVRKGGWKRAVKEGRRNVHAFCRGTVARWSEVPREAIQVMYHRGFGIFCEVTDVLKVRVEAREAWLDERGRLWVF